MQINKFATYLYEYYSICFDKIAKIRRKKNDPVLHPLSYNSSLHTRDRPRFFDQVGHQTTNASIGNKHIFTK